MVGLVQWPKEFVRRICRQLISCRTKLFRKKSEGILMVIRNLVLNFGYLGNPSTGFHSVQKLNALFRIYIFLANNNKPLILVMA